MSALRRGSEGEQNMTTHQARWQAADSSRREMATRALNVSNSGSILLQTYINRTVQQLTVREHGAQAVLDRKPGTGDAARINRRTAGTTGGEWVADTGSATEEVGSYAQTSFTYRTLLTRGKVTRKLQATGKSYGDVLGEELIGKTEDFANALENGLFVGNSAANANQINGLLTLINAVSGQVVANTSATGGDDLLLAKLDAAIDAVKGAGNRADLVIFGSFAGCRALNAAIQAQQQFNDMVEVAAGFRVRSYDGIPIVVSTEMPDDLVWSGTSITAFTGGATTALVVANKRFTYIEELTPTTVQPLAKTDSQYDEFDMYADLALVFSNTKGGAILGGILPN
jgi:hypothetical protein